MAALVLANTPWSDAYFTLRDTVIGIEWGHLDLTVGHWAGDGLLAIFFFVAGLELKREFLVGDLRSPAKAVVPVVAAVGGVVVPALVFVATVDLLGAEGDALRGWAIPTATDIAFALAVLAVIGSLAAVGAALVPADPRGGRRPHRDHDHRRSSTPPTSRSGRCCWPWSRWPCSRP